MRPRSGFSNQALAWLAIAAIALPAAFSCARISGRSAKSGGAAKALQLPDLAAQPAPPARVLLVSIAGLAPAQYRGASGRRAEMPVVAALGRAGVSADALESVTPDSVYPSHATLVTGRRPDQHGIVSDHLLGDRGVRAARFWHASRLSGSSLWQQARAAKLGVVALGWPSTVGASIDWLLPDIAPVRRGDSWLEVLNGAATPWLVEIARRAAPPEGDAAWPSGAQRDALIVDIACEIAGQKSAPALWLLRLGEGGAALRDYGPGSAEARAAFGRVDQQIGRLLGCLGEASLLGTSALLLVGDQSVQPVHTRIDPNVALARARLISLDSGGGGISSWFAISRSNGGSAFVYARSESAAVRARTVLAEEARLTRAFRVLTATELRQRHGDPQAWFGLEARPGFVFGDAAQGPVQGPAEERGAGGYSAGEGGVPIGFVAWGRGVRQAVRVPVMPLIDVAPTAAALLGLRLDDAEGRPLVGLLQMNPPGTGLVVPAARRSR